MRMLTAGESHGAYNVAILEGFPKGVKIEEAIINKELKRRMSGFGRGKRMSIEHDTVDMISGLRNKQTLGSPIAMLIKNKDAKIFTQGKDNLPFLAVPRPSHADLAGAFKYQETDIRNILERSSARETVARVCIGSICKQFLSNFNVKIGSFTVSVGEVTSSKNPKTIAEILSKTKNSKVNCIDKNSEKLMVELIKKCMQKGDSLGGVAEVWVDGLCPGLGSMMHFDKRLDARIAASLMSIPAIKGVEIGLGFEYAMNKGSQSHDAIYYAAKKGFYRNTNNSGGIEGGMSTAEPIVVRLAMKPIATLINPLDSVNLRTKKKKKAPAIRSDTCAIVACGVIAENMLAITITEALLEKFGCDSLKEIKLNYKNYLKACKNI